MNNVRVFLLFLPLALFCSVQAEKPMPEILREYHMSNEKRAGWSELAYAIEKGYVIAADTMIRNGVDPNQTNEDGSMTPFVAAIQYGYPQLVERMISYKADVNKPVKGVLNTCMPQFFSEEYPDRTCPPDVYSPLLAAIQFRQTEIAALLLEEGADPFYRSYLHYQPIHLAVRHEQDDTLVRLLNKGADPNVQDMWGYSPLHYCAFLPDSPMAAKLGALLLERGADPNKKIEGSNIQFTPLHLAAMNGHGDLVQLLIARRAEIDTEDSQGTTPLWRAAASAVDDRDTVRGLLQARANPNKINRHAAAQDLMGEYGASILAAAILRHKIDTAELLIQNGAQVDIIDAHGKTPLMYAVSDNDPDAVILLLKYKANPNNPGGIGRTPMEIAHNLEHQEVFELLIGAHADQMYK